MDWDQAPEIGEIVVVKVKRILDYGAFVELVEYNNATGFVHISEIASRWVKNIRNHVKENQIRAAKVLSLNPHKKQIDLSLTKVSEGLSRQRLAEFKKQKRSQKLLELFCQKNKVAFSVAESEIAEPLLEHYDFLFDAFSKIALEGESAAKGVSPKWVNALVKLCQDSIETPQKTVEADVSLSSNASNGVEFVREAVLAGLSAGKGVLAQAFYTGSGHFSVRVTAPSFKQAERGLEGVTQKIVATIKSRGGSAEAKKIEHKG